MTGSRLDDEQRKRWHTDGWCVLEGFFTPDEVAEARRAVGELFPSAEAVSTRRDTAGGGDFDVSWDATKPAFPFASSALNDLTLHDDLIDVAEDLLGTDQLRLYQGMVSAKYSDGTPDYEQLLHVDYANHTLVVPRTDVGYQQAELFVYLSDVTPETAATRVVSRQLTVDIPVERSYLDRDDYAGLYAAEVPASGPAGSVLAYRPDVYHRGTTLSAPDSSRFLLHAAFKPAGTDWLGFQAWPAQAEGMEWGAFMTRATLRQLTMLGFPEPGHPYWTEATLRGVAARYPLLDMSPWQQVTPQGDS